MELLEQIVSVLAGTVGLGAGAAALLSRRSDRKSLPSPTSGQSMELSSYSDETSLAKPRQPAGLARALNIGGLAFLVPVPFAIWAHDPLGVVWVGPSALYFYLARASKKDRSATYRSATLTLSASTEDVMHRSHAVLKDLKLRIVSFDLETGLIEARRGLNLRTMGERVFVHVDADSRGGTRVMIESDASWTTTGYDWGANRRNVDRFVEGLTNG